MMLTKRKDDNFPFKKNDVVLAKYDHELFYAKIISISYKRKIARLLFDDESREDVPFQDIFDVNETTSDIICVICKKDSTDTDNDIVLCDECNVGYHQTCHDPIISSDVLKPEIPWECVYCSQKLHNPHIESNPFEEDDDTEEQMDMDNVKVTDTQICQESFERMKVDDQKPNDFSTVTLYKEDSQNTLDGVNVLEPEKSLLKSIELEIDANSNNDYGEQVVIAHADSTSKEEEDLIVDIESDEDCCHQRASVVTPDPVQDNEDKVSLQAKGVSKITEQTQPKNDRYFKDLPKHNWLIEKLKMENKLNGSEIDQMEKTVYTQQKSQKAEENNDFLKRFLEEKSLKQKPAAFGHTDVTKQNSTTIRHTVVSSKRDIVEKLTREERISKVLTCETDCNNNNHIRISNTHVSTTVHEKITKSNLCNDQQPRTNKMPSQISPQLVLNFDQQKQKDYPRGIYRRQISDITDLRSAPRIHIPITSYSPTTEQPRYFKQDILRNNCHSDLFNTNHTTRPCKTKIFKPEEIDRCLRNFTSDHDDTDIPFYLHPYYHLQNRNNSPANRNNSSPIRFTNGQTNTLHSSVERTIVQQHRYEPYTSTYQRRSRISSDSTVQYLTPANVRTSPQTKRPSSAPRRISECEELIQRSLISPRSSPGYFTSSNSLNSQNFKDLKTGHTQNFNRNMQCTSTSSHKCLNCGRAAQMLCSGCRKARYCSTKCQHDDWREHLYHCKVDIHE